MEQTDWHRIAEDRFADEVAAELAVAHRAKPFSALILIAPPRTLAELRRSLPDELRGLVIAEIDKDSTKLPLDEIEKRLARL